MSLIWNKYWISTMWGQNDLSIHISEFFWIMREKKILKTNGEEVSQKELTPKGKEFKHISFTKSFSNDWQEYGHNYIMHNANSSFIIAMKINWQRLPWGWNILTVYWNSILFCVIVCLEASSLYVIKIIIIIFTFVPSMRIYSESFFHQSAHVRVTSIYNFSFSFTNCNKVKHNIAFANFMMYWVSTTN